MSDEKANQYAAVVAQTDDWSQNTANSIIINEVEVNKAISRKHFVCWTSDNFSLTCHRQFRWPAMEQQWNTKHPRNQRIIVPNKDTKHSRHWVSKSSPSVLGGLEITWIDGAAISRSLAYNHTKLNSPAYRWTGLRPYCSHSQPTTMVATMPPMPRHEPIHAISSRLSAPVGIGDSSDSSTRKADDVHPTAVPYASVWILAAIDWRMRAFLFDYIENIWNTRNNNEILINHAAVHDEKQQQLRFGHTYTIWYKILFTLYCSVVFLCSIYTNLIWAQSSRMQCGETSNSILSCIYLNTLSDYIGDEIISMRF